MLLTAIKWQRIKTCQNVEGFVVIADFCCLLQVYIKLRIKRKYDFSRTVVVRVFCASLNSHTHTKAKSFMKRTEYLNLYMQKMIYRVFIYETEWYNCWVFELIVLKLICL